MRQRNRIWTGLRAMLGLGGALWLFAGPASRIEAACAPWGPCISVERPTIRNDRPEREPRERTASSDESSGAGCASTSSADYTPTEQRYPNLRRGGDGKIYAREGYVFASSDPNDYTVVRKPDGALHERFANVVWTGDGNLRPAAGYQWAGRTPEEIRASGYRVEPLPAETPHAQYPNVVWSGDGRHIRPADGYAWTSSPPSNDGYRVAPLPEGSRHARYPNVIWVGDGRQVRPADGYLWASTTPAADGFRVVPRPSGSAHERYPNVVWTGDGIHIRPAPGHRWTSPNNPGADGFRTVAEAPAAPPPHQAETGRPDPSSSAPPGATPGRLQPFPQPGARRRPATAIRGDASTRTAPGPASASSARRSRRRRSSSRKSTATTRRSSGWRSSRSKPIANPKAPIRNTAERRRRRSKARPPSKTSPRHARPRSRRSRKSRKCRSRSARRSSNWTRSDARDQREGKLIHRASLQAGFAGTALLALSQSGALAEMTKCPDNSELYRVERPGLDTILRCRCLTGFVPSGDKCIAIQARVHIWIKAFIPNQHPGNSGYVREAPWAKGSKWIIPGPTIPFTNRPFPYVGRDCYETDHRWFSSDPRASARITSEAVLVIEGPSLRLVTKDTRPMQRADRTHRVECTTGEDIVEPKRADTGSNRFDPPSMAGYIAQLRVKALGRNPLVPPSPAIDYSGTFSFNARTRQLSFTGEIGKFPAFEAYASLNDGAPVALFRYEPAPGTTTWALLDGGTGVNMRPISAQMTLP